VNPLRREKGMSCVLSRSEFQLWPMEVTEREVGLVSLLVEALSEFPELRPIMAG